MQFQCSHCAAVLEGDPGSGEATACEICGAVAVVPPDPFSPGAVLGEYAVREQLPSEEGGHVLAAVNLTTGAPVQLYLPDPARLAAPGAAEEFYRRAAAAAQLRHPNLVSVLEAGQAEGLTFLVVEAVEGTTLNHVLAHSGRLVPERALDIAAKINQALDFAWREQQLPHLDVRPENILLTDNAVKLTGFGLPHPALNPRNIPAENWLGDAAGLAPERFLGKPAPDHRTDIYSLGAVLYQCLTGKPPYQGRRPGDTAQLHLLQKLTPPRKLNPAVTEPVSRLVEIMLAKRPEHRYQDGTQLDADLTAVRHGKTLSRSPARGSQKPLPPPGVVRIAGQNIPPPEVKNPLPMGLWIGLAAGAAVLLVAGGGLLLAGGKHAPKPNNVPAIVTLGIAKPVPATATGSSRTTTSGTAATGASAGKLTPTAAVSLPLTTTAATALTPPPAPIPVVNLPPPPTTTTEKPQSEVPENGTGLSAQYFSGGDTTKTPLTRTDPCINFTWNEKTPALGFPRDNFTARWTGQILPRYSGLYRFIADVDDGATLTINGTIVFSRFSYDKNEVSGTIRLEAGKKADFCLDYIQGSGSARIILYWSNLSQPREIVPQGCLFPSFSGTPPPFPVSKNANKSASDKIPANPVFSPPPGIYRTLPAVTLACTTTEATICYSNDGRKSWEQNLRYANPVTLDKTTTIIAASQMPNGGKRSSETTGVYSTPPAELVKLKITENTRTTSAAEHLLKNSYDGTVSPRLTPDIFTLKKEQSATYELDYPKAVLELRIARPLLDAKPIRIEVRTGSKEPFQWVPVVDSLKLAGPTGKLNVYPLPYCPRSINREVRITALTDTIFLDEVEFWGVK